MDLLSDILRVIPLHGTLYFRAELGSPFGLAVPRNEGAARFHIALEGECTLELGEGEGEGVRLRRGELALVPHGARHHLVDTPARSVVELDAALAASGWTGAGPFRYGGPGARTTLVCGHFAFPPGVLHPLLDALPRVLHFGADAGHDFRWLDDVMRYIGEEAGGDRAGREAVLSRLAEILFIHMLRAYVESCEEDSAENVLAAIADPQLGRALTLIHERPAQKWSLQALAQGAGMSRTLFAERFAACVQLTPMQYLTRWRIELAKAQLRQSERSVAEVADSVGYLSEAAFGRAFKRLVGVGPGGYRASWQRDGAGLRA